MTFSFDTSAIIGAWRKRLPPDVVPSFWERLDLSVASGEVRAIEDVMREIEKKDDDVKSWASARPDLFLDMTEQVWDEAHIIITQFPELTKPLTGRNAADPFVVALAKVNSAVVVSEEMPATKPNKTKIPDVCRELGIACVDVYGFVRMQQWRF